jgi:hypothetical protein
MPATQITKSVRFIQPGVTTVLFVPTAVDYKAMLRTELDAGTDLTKELASPSGWTTTSNSVDTPDFGSRFTSKVPGMITVDDSSLTFYGSKTGEDVRAILPRDTTGYIVFADGGLVDAQPMDVYPITVSSLGKVRSASDPFQIQVSFTVTDVPSEDQDIPAAA